MPAGCARRGTRQRELAAEKTLLCALYLYLYLFSPATVHPLCLPIAVGWLPCSRDPCSPCSTCARSLSPQHALCVVTS